MDALPDIKQLQLETKRLSQGIDKMVNPPMVADIQLKNAPASMLPGGVTYVSGVAASGRPGFAPAYLVNPQVNEMMQEIQTVKGRISETFFNNLFQTISQYETRSNVTATEIDARRAEAMLMLGPVLERLNHECFAPLHERVFAIASRAGILPPAPKEIQGLHMNVEFISMIELAQNANQASGIERLLTLAGQTAAIDPAVIDNVDIDYSFDKLNYLYNNDPKLVRSPKQLTQIRQQRQQQQEQQQKLAAAESMSKSAQQGASAAQAASQTPTGNGTNALQQLLGNAG
jgi:hypothetical protein